MTYHLVYDSRLAEVSTCYIFLITDPNYPGLFAIPGAQWRSSIPEALDILLTADLSRLQSGAAVQWLDEALFSFSELPTLEWFTINHPELLI